MAFNDRKHAVAAFNAICQAFEAREWKYRKDEDALVINSGARGEDLPVDITFKVDVKRQIVLLISRLPFDVPEDKRVDMAAAVCRANAMLIDGCFDYDVIHGMLFFRVTNSFLDSDLGDDTFQYMLNMTCTVVDDFNDKFFMLAMGVKTLDELFD